MPQLDLNTLKDQLVEKGNAFEQCKIQFDRFAEEIKPLEKEIKSLVFHGKFEGQIRFSFLGQEWRIQNESDYKQNKFILGTSQLSKIDNDEKWAEGNYAIINSSFSKASFDDGKMWMDIDDAKVIFYYLIMDSTPSPGLLIRRVMGPLERQGLHGGQM